VLNQTYFTHYSMKQSILTALHSNTYNPSNLTQLCKLLEIPDTHMGKLQETLKQLIVSGEITVTAKRRYKINEADELVSGQIQITPSGRGFVLPTNPNEPEISIPSRDTGIALNRDHVLVKLCQRPKHNNSNHRIVTGSVIKVTQRHRSQFVGILHRNKNGYFVALDDPRVPHDIFVPAPHKGKISARDGDKVQVELTGWASPEQQPVGKLIANLGNPDAAGVDMLGVLCQYNLSEDFPTDVLNEIDQMGSEVSAEDLKGRIDCRQHPVITIDPADAKDFDDAFSLNRSSENRWTLRVHIADVSHYVKLGSALDREALRRGNSTYLIDRVIPMLPTKLSNHLCSLVPHQDRLTKCVEFILNNDGRVLRSRIYEAVIHSKHRFTYEQAMQIIDGNARNSIEKMLQAANRLAKSIRERRIKGGALDMDFQETKIHLDDHGTVTQIEPIDYDASHQLIEEFMLLANEAVARQLDRLQRPTLFRVHEAPDKSRLIEYCNDLRKHGVRCGNLEKTSEVQKLFKKLDKLDIGRVLKIGFLKSLMRAHYSPESNGHYGLAKSSYTHFTSPIRRYADLIVHRSLFEKQKSASMTQMANHITATERNSADAERDSKQLKLFAFLKSQLDLNRRQKYHAVVTDVQCFGVLVDVPPLGMKGIIPFPQLKDDYYQFDATKNRAVGQRNGKIIQLADVLQVMVAKVDTARGRIDFTIPRNHKRRRTGKKRKTSKPQDKAP